MKYVNPTEIPKILDTGVKNVKSVGKYCLTDHAAETLEKITRQLFGSQKRGLLICDSVFSESVKNTGVDSIIKLFDNKLFVHTEEEPKTNYVDDLFKDISGGQFDFLVSVGGGATLDIGKALSNLLTNGGFCADYQGWDLVKYPGKFKIAIPTLFGTGAEASRTCVLTNPVTGIKLGMNSDHSIFDQLIIDPNLSETVPRDQYFYTAMDTYIHCIESLNGIYRNEIADAYSRQALSLCEHVFLSEEPFSKENRKCMAVASYLGGSAIGASYVGLVHPFSAALSVVYGTKHCVGNCMALTGLREYYPDEYAVFERMATSFDVMIPTIKINQSDIPRLTDALLKHQKPLTNALGERYLDVLIPSKIEELFWRISCPDMS